MVLLIGYGNPGRCDDGLGPALAERIFDRDLPGVTVKIDYQLKVEHALMVAGAGAVIFADARIGGTGPFGFDPVAGAASDDLGSHDLSPGALMRLTGLLYGAAPPAYTLGITGDQFGHIEEGLSPVARANLDRAEAFLIGWLAERRDSAAAAAT